MKAVDFVPAGCVETTMPRVVAKGWGAAEAERIESQARQRQFKTQALVEVASAKFNKDGYEGLSLSEVAASLGITKQALYHYTRSKEDLLYKCYVRSLDLAEEAYNHADGHASSGLEKIIAFVKFHLHSNPERYAILDNLGALSDAHRRAISTRAKGLEQRMRGFISDGMKDRSIAAVDPKFTEFWILGSLAWMPKWFKPDGQMSVDEVAQSFLQLICDGLRPRG